MVGHAVSKSIKWKVKGVCEKCGQSFTATWNNVWLRKAYKGLEVCGKCGRKEQFTEEWKRNNSAAQKRVQGTPEARKKMSEILCRVHQENPEIGRKISQGLRDAYVRDPGLREKISAASKRKWREPGYQEKVTGQGYHHGWFVSRSGQIYFASSWELMFLVWCENNNTIVRFCRCQDVIPYTKPNGGSAFYHPDFELEFVDSHILVAEIKGDRQEIDLTNRKRQAAEGFYENKKEYTVLFKADLKRMGIFIRERKSLNRWIFGLEEEGLVVNHAKGKSHKSGSLQGSSSRPLC
jgi:hypothetical protein